MEGGRQADRTIMGGRRESEQLKYILKSSFRGENGRSDSRLSDLEMTLIVYCNRINNYFAFQFKTKKLNYLISSSQMFIAN